MVDIKENNNIFETASNLTDKFNYQRDYAFQSATAKSNMILKQREEDYSNARSDLYAHCMEMKKYSTFDASMLGNMLALLISLVEGRNYTFKEAEHHYNDWRNGEYDGFRIKTYKFIQVIIDDEDFKYWNPTTPDFEGIDYLPNPMIEKYNIHGYENRNRFREHFIVLTKEEAHKGFAKSITFYDYDIVENKLASLVNFGRFDYVKELIDSLVQYRYEKGLVEFTEDDMLEFLSTYLDNNKDVRFTAALRDKMLVRNA